MSSRVILQGFGADGHFLTQGLGAIVFATTLTRATPGASRDTVIAGGQSDGAQAGGQSDRAKTEGGTG